MKANPLTTISPKTPVRVQALESFAALPKNLKKAISVKDFKAAAIVDKNGDPKLFVFDTRSLWDMLCAADERFEETASDEAYITDNRLGWLIDELESHLPLNPQFVQKLRRGLASAKTSGLVPFEQVKKSLGLN